MRFLILFVLTMHTTFSVAQTTTDQDTLNAVDALVLEAYGKLDPSIMQVMKDSGAVNGGNKQGRWKEYFYRSCVLEHECGNEKLQYDSLKKHESPGNLIFYLYRGNYIKGFREGVWKSLSTSRLSEPFEWELDDEVNYVNGKMNGWRTEYSLGRVSIRTFYSHGIRDSVRLVYHKNGQLWSRQRYKNDIPHGSTEDYLESGQIEKEYVFEKGEIVNLILYKSDGYFLKNGKREGKFKAYSYDEKIMVEGEYVNDETEGVMKFYNENGAVVCIQHQTRGKSNGLYTWYHDNGKIWTELMMKDGKTMEVISNYSSEGKPMPKGTLKNGTGTVIRYDEKGNQIAIDHYKDGVAAH